MCDRQPTLPDVQKQSKSSSTLHAGQTSLIPLFLHFDSGFYHFLKMQAELWAVPKHLCTSFYNWNTFPKSSLCLSAVEELPLSENCLCPSLLFGGWCHGVYVTCHLISSPTSVAPPALSPHRITWTADSAPEELRGAWGSPDLCCNTNCTVSYAALKGEGFWQSTCCPDSSLLPRSVSCKVESWPAWIRIQDWKLKALGWLLTQILNQICQRCFI